MTEQEKAAKRAELAVKKPPRSRRSVIAATAALAVSLSVAVFGGLSLQMAKGQDPVLAQKSDRPVVKKRIVVIKKMIQPRKTITTPSYSSASPSYSSSASYSAPSTSAPAPAPAPVVSSPS